ncbi:helix-turn-helix domain-containing protein [Paenibacillus sp. y28]|uniref:helix-turn-helix domain-containing protein n=1 Tax=Paenibacillus sp. y28 TaxID=3129110 RepID=UPI00301B395E
MSELGKLLRALRGKESLRDVSSRAGISHTYLGIVEKGVDPRSGNAVKPTPETLRILAQAYDYSYEKLMNAAGYWKSPEIGESGVSYGSEHGLGDAVELTRVFQSSSVTLKGRPLTEAERKKALDMLLLLLEPADEPAKKPKA